MGRYIDRDFLASKLKDYFSNKPYLHFDLNAILHMLEICPTADVVEVKHGEWIRPTHFLDGGKIKIKNPFYFCSNCSQDVKPKKRTNYCPNCGAKMDLKEGAEE